MSSNAEGNPQFVILMKRTKYYTLLKPNVIFIVVEPTIPVISNNLFLSITYAKLYHFLII